LEERGVVHHLEHGAEEEDERRRRRAGDQTHQRLADAPELIPGAEGPEAVDVQRERHGQAAGGIDEHDSSLRHGALATRFPGGVVRRAGNRRQAKSAGRPVDCGGSGRLDSAAGEWDRAARGRLIPPALSGFKPFTAVRLLAGAVGWHARAVLPLAAVGYLVFGGILRQYSAFYHAGLVPLYVLGVLCFTPCTDAWSMDRASGRRPG